jgi:hypothetical protein
MRLQGYRRKLRIWESNYGDNAGWVIERKGVPIAVLTEPRFEDMFWVSYRMEITTKDVELSGRMLTKEFWLKAESEGIAWRSRAIGELAPFAFPALSPFPEPGRLMMRALYLPIPGPKPWDHVVLLVRRWLKRTPNASIAGHQAG